MTPRIRLKGFTDAWEQRKLEDISSVITKGTTPKDKSWRGEVNYVKTESIDSNSGNISVMANTSLEEHEGYLKRSQLQDGDVLFTIVGTLGRIGVVKNKDLPANTNQQIAIIRLNNANNRFVFHALKTSRIASFIKSDATIGAQPSLSLWQINGLKIPYPSLKEQDKIGGFFEHLDHLITLHQRKLDLLKEQKKGYLQKMFPKNGAKVPELRFAGFADAWEERKLGEEFKKVSERNNGSFGRDHWISVAKMYFQSPEKVQSNNIDTRTYVMREGDIAFEGHPNSEFKFGRFVANDIGAGVVSELFPIYKHQHEYDNNYWKNAIQIERIMAPIFAKSITSSGNSSNKLDTKHFLRQKILIPQINEQKKMGSFFKQLDNAIALHQRKLDLLKEQKKGFLQNMFV